MRENVGNQLPSWHKQRAIFLLKKITQFCRISSLSSHRRVINYGNSSCGFCLCILSVTSRVSIYKRTTLHSFSLFSSFFSSCQTFISYIHIYICIDWTLLVPSTRKWRRTRVCTYILLRQILYHDQSLFGLLHNG
jgi:hypothetical protein